MQKDALHPSTPGHHPHPHHPHHPHEHPHEHRDTLSPKTIGIFVAAGVVAIAAAVLVMSTAVREVDVKNTGDVEIRVNWKAANQAPLDRRISPGTSRQFTLEPSSELVVFHPAPQDNVQWTVVPVTDDTKKIEIAPKSAGTITATRDGAAVTLTTSAPPLSR